MRKTAGISMVTLVPDLSSAMAAPCLTLATAAPGLHRARAGWSGA